DRLVVKAVVPDLVHKTEAGAVAIVPREQVAQAMAAMAHLSPQAFLVVAFVPHDVEPGGELLVSLRWTREHGAVVTLGLGGVTAEAVGRPVAIHAPGLPVQVDPGLLALASGRLRGRAGRCGPEQVLALVERLLAAAPLLPDPLDEVEINPLVFADGGWVALDAVVRLGGPSSPRRAPPVDLSGFLSPSTMAIAGASARGENPGRTILRATLAAGFPPARLFVVKEGQAELDGCPCVPGVQDLPPVDLLVLAVPAEAVPALWPAALERARAVVLIPGGTGERPGTEGLATSLRTGLEQAWAQGRPTRVVGGNSLGVRSSPGRVDTLFVPQRRVGPAATTAPVAVVSNSGALALALDSALPVAPRLVLTLGNQLDLSIADAVEGLIPHPDAQVVLLYVEGLPDGDGERLVRATAALTAAGRTVIAYRAGRTPAGRAATASHTAALAGDARVFSALMARAGALIADSLDDLVDLSMLALSGPRPAGGRLAVVSNAGFECVAAADHLGGLVLAAPSAQTLADIDAILAAGRLGGLVAAHNPLDLTPIARDQVYVQAAGRLLQDPGVDVGVIGCIPFTQALQTLPGEGDLFVDGLASLRGKGAPFVVAIEGGALYDPLRARLRAAGLCVFPKVDRAVRALARWVG
ncbi:acetate--CoA ligase family protein, partial [Myxococcota bacterium]|nr:acetate--CoA ligase family protein [Myxococcota bacterium]